MPPVDPAQARLATSPPPTPLRSDLRAPPTPLAEPAAAAPPPSGHPAPLAGLATCSGAPPEPAEPGRVAAVEPIRFSAFLIWPEGAAETPLGAEALWRTEPTLLAHANRLRDAVLDRAALGAAPLQPLQLYDLAMREASHAATALLLCHNVTRSFARGGEAVTWRCVDRRRGTFSDGRRFRRPGGGAHSLGRRSTRQPPSTPCSLLHRWAWATRVTGTVSSPSHAWPPCTGRRAAACRRAPSPRARPCGSPRPWTARRERSRRPCRTAMKTWPLAPGVGPMRLAFAEFV